MIGWGAYSAWMFSVGLLIDRTYEMPQWDNFAGFLKTHFGIGWALWFLSLISGDKQPHWQVYMYAIPVLDLLFWLYTLLSAVVGPVRSSWLIVKAFRAYEECSGTNTDVFCTSSDETTYGPDGTNQLD